MPIILYRNQVDNGQSSVSDVYRQYVYIYLPGILGAVLALIFVQLPILGRKWSLVGSAILQGIGMAMYTQVSNTAAYVGLNAFAYIMQTVSRVIPYESGNTDRFSFSTRSFTPRLPSYSLPPTEEVPAVCFPPSAELPVLSLPSRVRHTSRMILEVSSLFSHFDQS